MTGSDVALLGGAIFAYALVSRRLAGSPITPAIAFVSIGLVIGSEGLDLLELEGGSSELRLLAEITLALLLFTDAAGLDSRRLTREVSFPARLLGVALPLTIVLGSVVAIVAFPDLLVFEAVALAVLLAPTDAALGQVVVSDRRLPSVVRQGLNAESGLNDGVCVPLLLAAVSFAELEEAPSFDGEVLVDLVEELAVAGIVGLAVGVLVGRSRNAAVRGGWMSDRWELVVPLAAAAVAYAVTVELHGSGFIGSFVAGLVFGRVVGAAAVEDTELTEDLGLLLSGITFVLFGAVLVGPGIETIDAPTVVYAVLSLTVLRMVPVAIALIGSRARPPTVALAGWFGPRGLATIVFVLTIVEDAGLDGTRQIVDVATLTVLLSVFAHGITGPWLVGRYAAWRSSHSSELVLEADDDASGS